VIIEPKVVDVGDEVVITQEQQHDERSEDIIEHAASITR
jgi:hypothetical protein